MSLYRSHRNEKDAKKRMKFIVATPCRSPSRDLPAVTVTLRVNPNRDKDKARKGQSRIKIGPKLALSLIFSTIFNIFIENVWECMRKSKK